MAISKNALRLRSAWLVTSALFAAATGGSAHAQSTNARPAAPTPEASTNADESSDEIVVTATRRSERLLDVPQSVSVLTDDDLQKIGATQFRDFANTVPGLSFATSGAGYTQITLRGVTAGVDIGTTVATYVDDVPWGATSPQTSLDVGLFDVDRVEVLRGPQGTLYGSSSLGGLIKYVTKQPDSRDFGGSVRAGISSTRDGGISYDGSASINAPIVTDKAAMRLTGFYSHDGGYIDNLALGRNDVNRSNSYGGRADLLLTPTERLSIRLTGFLQNISRDGEATADFNYNGTPIDSALDQRRQLSEPFEQRYRLASATINYDLGFANLVSITSYQSTKIAYTTDVTGVYAPLLSLYFGLNYSGVGLVGGFSRDKFAQEVRLSSEGSGHIEWILGGYYSRESGRTTSSFDTLDLARAPVTNTLLNSVSRNTLTEYAAFGDVTWHLSPKFDVTGGLRYAHLTQHKEQPLSTGSLAPAALPPARASENVVTYLANARYHLSDRATIYARFATGYRPGGANARGIDLATGLPVGPASYDADHLNSYEMGLKAETSDRTFGVDFAAYYLDWQRMQIQIVSTGFAGFGNAAGGATVRGGELALTARPDRSFTVVGAFAYQDAKLSENEPSIGGTKGERLPNVPRFTATISADYAPPSKDLAPTLGATLRFVSDRQASFNNSTGYRQYRLPDYAMVDLRAGVTVQGVRAQIFVRNIFDKRGQLSALNWRGPAMPAITQPRTVGVSASAKF